MTSDLVLELPKACPFSVRRLNESFYLFREHDAYGQYPNIYAKICHSATPSTSAVIVLSDTGCATTAKNPNYGSTSKPDEPESWNLNTVLRHTINPGGRLPYLVMTTHCHFDHILGIGVLPPTDSDPRHGNISQRQGPPTTVLSSAYDPDYINPWEHLCRHSFCKVFDSECPFYNISMWAKDLEDVVYTSQSGIQIPTGITILHTPGHTRDSLSWYDAASHLLSVGDSFYETTSQDTLNSKWGGEIRGPILFEARSDLTLWWTSLARLIAFTKKKNAALAREHTGPQPPPRVAISAAHVTTLSPDAEAYLLSIRAFMSRILRDEVPNGKIDQDWLPLPDLWGWDDGEQAGKSKPYEWIVWAPKKVIEQGRGAIPREEMS